MATPLRLTLAAMPAVLLAAMPALAQTPLSGDPAADILDVFTGEGDPLSNIFLARIFGCRLFPIVGTDCDTMPVPVFATAIGLFNGFCLALGMALFAWNVSVGIAQTAHEGQVLGRNWSSLWAPVRTLTAAAMLTPLPAIDGYNAVQAGLSMLVRGSTAAASIVWATTASQVITHQAPLTTPAVFIDQNTLHAAWRMVACQEVIEKIHRDYMATDGVSAVPVYLDMGDVPQVELQSPDDLMLNSTRPAGIHRFVTGITGVDADAAQDARRICGTIDLPAPPEIVRSVDRTADWHVAHRAALGRTLNSLRREARRLMEEYEGNPEEYRSADNLAAVIQRESRRYAADLANSLSSLAAAVGVFGDSAANASSRSTLTETARRRMDVIIGGAYSATCQNHQVHDDGWLADICSTGRAGQGWLGAGAWYMHMARFANEANRFFHSRPDVTPSTRFDEAMVLELSGGRLARAWRGVLGERYDEGAVPEMLVEMAAYESALDERWTRAVMRAIADGAAVDVRLISHAFAGEGGAAGPPGDAVTAPVREFLASKIRDWFLPPPTTDPMAALAEFGNAMLAWGLGLMGASFATSVLADLLPLGGLGDALGAAAMVIGFALMSAGAFLAFILPFLPFLLWTLAVTGYFILVAEAVIAANLWAVAHLRMDGEGFAGEAARQGYYLVLALTLTPILMVLGFLLGMAIFKVTATLTGLGVDVALRGLAHDQSWAVWLLGMAVLGIVLVIIYTVMAERSFSLVAELPGKILRWIGADANVTSREDDRVRGTAVAAAGAVVGTGREVVQIGTGAGRRLAGRVRGQMAPTSAGGPPASGGNP